MQVKSSGSIWRLLTLWSVRHIAVMRQGWRRATTSAGWVPGSRDVAGHKQSCTKDREQGSWLHCSYGAKLPTAWSRATQFGLMLASSVCESLGGSCIHGPGSTFVELFHIQPGASISECTSVFTFASLCRKLLGEWDMQDSRWFLCKSSLEVSNSRLLTQHWWSGCLNAFAIDWEG